MIFGKDHMISSKGHMIFSKDYMILSKGSHGLQWVYMISSDVQV